MAIKVGEIGKTLYVGTGFDLNAAPFTSISIKFTSPDGSTTVTRSNPDVTAPIVDSPALPNVGVLPANTYMQYKTQADDFDVSGDWGLCVEYQDAVPSLFFGDDTILGVEDGC